MTLRRLVLNERDYILDGPSADRAAADILQAVRHGGDFVQLASVTDIRTRVLVTPATPVRFETIAAGPGEEIDGAVEAAWVYYDFDIGD